MCSSLSHSRDSVVYIGRFSIDGGFLDVFKFLSSAINATRYLLEVVLDFDDI